DKHDTVGIDCVAMCVNDIVCAGAAPLFFLDYLAVGKNIPARIEAIVSGVAEGCRQAGCALIGGETAEMPGFYPENEYDLAGFSVGLADQENMLDGSRLQVGDLLIGLGSSGVHSNGFSLVRKALGVDEKVLGTKVAELGCTIGEELIKPTHIYVKSVLGLLHHGVQVRAISHITGGGLYENVPRMMTPGLTAHIRKADFPVHPIFDLIAKTGKIPERDMYNTFNMGVGMVIAIPKAEVGTAVDLLSRMGEQPYVIGCVTKGDAGIELV
ncbi:MAG: phosphoribosylformylglycinamidine cyclo-ligase, partial [Pseudoflavonifractor sp.]